MRHALALTALSALACTALPPPAEDAAADVKEEEFVLCVRPCPAGQVCRGFRCVAVFNGDAGSDVTASDAPRVDATSPTVACCPIDPTPHCDCVRAGGPRRADGTCRTICGEGYPELWFRRTDDDGCQVWSTPGLPCPRDAGADADAR